MITSSELTRLNRAKLLATSTNVTSPNRSGDYLSEKRYGSGPVLANGKVIKGCCEEQQQFTPGIIITYDNLSRMIGRDVEETLSVTGEGYTIDWGNGELVSYSGLRTFNIATQRTGLTITIREDSALTAFSLTDSNASACTVHSCAELLSVNCTNNLLLTTLLFIDTFNLQSLDCTGNDLTTLNCVGFDKLTSLDCASNDLTSLNMTGCTSFASFDSVSILEGNPGIALNLTGCTGITGELSLRNISNSFNVASAIFKNCTGITKLICNECSLNSIDLTGATSLNSLICNGNNMTSLNMTGCTAFTPFLTDLLIGNNMASLNLSGCTALTEMIVEGIPLASVNLTGCSNLTNVKCKNTGLTSINGVDNLPLLEKLNVYTNPPIPTGNLHMYTNKLATLTIKSSNLTELICTGNLLTTLDASNCTKLTTLECDFNNMDSLNVSNCSKLTHLNCSRNKLASLASITDVVSLVDIQCHYNNLNDIPVQNLVALQSILATHNYIQNNQLVGILLKLKDLDTIGNITIVWQVQDYGLIPDDVRHHAPKWEVS